MRVGVTMTLGLAAMGLAWASFPAVAQGTRTGPGGEQTTVAGHQVRVVKTGDLIHDVLVDNRPVIHDDESMVVLIQGSYEGGGHTYVLVAVASGGVNCPSRYQAIDLSAATPKVSQQFGNCSDLPKVAVGADGALRVSFLKYKASPAETDVFKDGRFSR